MQERARNAIREARKLRNESEEIGREYDEASRLFDTTTEPEERLRFLLLMSDAHARRLAKMIEASKTLARAEAEIEIAIAEAQFGSPSTIQ